MGAFGKNYTDNRHNEKGAGKNCAKGKQEKWHICSKCCLK